MKGTIAVLCIVLIGALALPTPILEPRFKAGAPAGLSNKDRAAKAKAQQMTLGLALGKMAPSHPQYKDTTKQFEQAKMDAEQYEAQAATDELVATPQVIGFGKERLPDAQVPGEVPKTLLTNKEVDIVARNVLAAARKNACGKKGEFCDLKLAGEFKKPGSKEAAKKDWRSEYLAKVGKAKGKGKRGGKGKKGKGAKAKAKKAAKKDKKKAKKAAKAAKKDKKKAKALAKKGAVKAAATLGKAAKLQKKASSDLKKAAKANKKGDKKKAKKLEKKAKKEGKQAKKLEKKAKKQANKVAKTKEECTKQKGKWDDKAKKCALKKK